MTLHRSVLAFALLLAACGGDDAAETAPETGSDTETTAGDEEVADAAEQPEEAEPAPEEDGPYLAVGTEAPDFEASDQSGASRRLSALRGNVVVLYFYPRDETPGCTREACAFRDIWESYEENDVVVLGVSVDSVESHLAFAQRHSLPFSLLADTDASITTAYGVRATEGDTVYSERVTYVIGADGAVAHVFEDVDPGVHAAEVLEVIAQLGQP